MSSTRDLAADDARAILHEEGAGSIKIEKPENGNEEKDFWFFDGIYSDIGSLFNPITGEPVQGRAIEATVSSLDVIKVFKEVPKRGWKVYIKGKDGKEIMLYVLRNEYDRTFDLCRLPLGLQLEDVKNE